VVVEDTEVVEVLVKVVVVVLLMVLVVVDDTDVVVVEVAVAVVAVVSVVVVEVSVVVVVVLLMVLVVVLDVGVVVGEVVGVVIWHSLNVPSLYESTTLFKVAIVAAHSPSPILMNPLAPTHPNAGSTGPSGPVYSPTRLCKSATMVAHVVPAVNARSVTVEPSALKLSSHVNVLPRLHFARIVFNQLTSRLHVPVVPIKSVPNELTHTSCESNGVVVTVEVGLEVTDEVPDVVGEVVAVVVVVGVVVSVVVGVEVRVDVGDDVGEVVGVVTSHPRNPPPFQAS
jgi:hypothetical protein